MELMKYNGIGYQKKSILTRTTDSDGIMSAVVIELQKLCWVNWT